MSANGTRLRKRAASTGMRRSQIVIAVTVLLSVMTAWSMLGHSGALNSAFRQTGKKNGTVSIQSFNSNSPSKEYVYAGGRLIVTEEQPGGSGCTPPSAPGTPTATATSANSVSLTWPASSGSVHHYEVERQPNITAVWSLLSPNPTTNSFTDNSVAGDTTYLYHVRAVDAGGQCPSEYSDIDLATTVMFTSDPPVATGNTIYAVHLIRLRTAVNAVQIAAGRSAFDWPDSSLPVTVAPASGGPILKDQVQKLRNRLKEARAALGVPPQPYTNEPLTQGTTVIANHILELRQGVK